MKYRVQVNLQVRCPFCDRLQEVEINDVDGAVRALVGKIECDYCNEQFGFTATVKPMELTNILYTSA